MNAITVSTDTSPNQRTAAAWPAVASLSLGVFGLVTAEFLPPSLLTPMSRDLNLSVGMGGQSVTVTAFVAAIAGPAVVVGTSRFDRRATLIALTLCLAVSSIVAALAGDLTTLLASRALLGIGLGGFWAISVALAMRLAPPEAVAGAMAVIMTGVSVATVCAAPLGAWLSATLGWRSAFFMSAAVGALALAAQVATMPALPPTGGASLSTLGAILRRPSIKFSLGATFCIAGGHFAAFTYVRPFLEKVSGFAPGPLSMLFLAFGIAGFFGNLLGGFVAQRSTRLAIASAAAGIAVAMLACVVGGTSHLVASGATMLWGLAFGAYPVSAQTFLTRAAPDDAESAGALQLTVYMIATSAGAILGGFLVDHLGPVSAFAFAGCAALLGALLVSAVGPPRDGRA